METDNRRNNWQNNWGQNNWKIIGVKNNWGQVQIKYLPFSYAIRQIAPLFLAPAFCQSIIAKFVPDPNYFAASKKPKI